MILFYGTHECIKEYYLHAFFSFLGFLRGGGEVSKRAKPDLKLLISVCFALYLRNCRSCHQDDHNGISRCFHFCFIIFLKKYTIVNAKIILFFIGPVLKFFF